MSHNDSALFREDHLVILNGVDLTIDHVVSVSKGAHVKIDDLARQRVIRAREAVDHCVQQREVVYGITTGFGSNADIFLESEEAALKLQENLMITHAVCVGDPLPVPVVRAMIAIRVNTLLRGHSGIRLQILDRLVELLNHDLIPVIPDRGSVGASGDLAPLCHMALPILGRGELIVNGKRVPSMSALGQLTSLQAAPRETWPIRLSYKEGLALSNGTTLMTAFAALSIHRFDQLINIADLSAAMTIEASCGRSAAFREDVHLLRPHPGQIKSAARLRDLLAGSTLIDIPFHWVSGPLGTWQKVRTPSGEMKLRGGKPPRPQDSYSLRCTPQVHGASRDALCQAKRIVEIELNAVTDNPLIFPDLEGEARFASAGHFHGMPIALAASYLKVAIPSLASISERRTNKLVDPATSDGLPPFLSRNLDGTESGFMIVQYTAAALVNELASRAHPATVYSIPTSANIEDHVSMGANEVRHVYSMIDDLARVLAFELLTAAQALDIRLDILNGTYWPPLDHEDDGVKSLKQSIKEAHLQPSPKIRAAHQAVRGIVDYMEADRGLSADVQNICEAIRLNPETLLRIILPS